MFLLYPQRKSPLTPHNRSHTNYQLLSQTKTLIKEDDHPNDLIIPISPQPRTDPLQEAIFAAGSFHELETAFSFADGVLRTATGYYGGTLHKPSYQQVCEGLTGHTEAVRVIFDMRKTSYKTLCKIFWKSHDPTSRDFLKFGAGTHLRSAIFYADEEQKRLARESKVERQMKLDRRIVTSIVPCGGVGFQELDCSQQKKGLQCVMLLT